MKKALLTVLAITLVVFTLTGCMTTDNSEKSYITVTASSTVTVVPDTASFTITAEAMADTTEEARNTSSLMIASAVEILKDEFGITDDEIKTNYMNINPYYEWLDGGRTLMGQKATQSLTITLKNGLDKVGKVYDRLSVLDGISISSITYSKLDTSDEEAQAREEATENAFRKAQDYVKGVSLTVGKLVNLSEGNVSYSYSSYSSNKLMMAESMAAADYSSTTYYAGDLSVSATVTAVFEIE